jgi:hypothetical protein
MRNSVSNRCLTVVILLVVVANAFGQKPRWVDNTPRELNHTYRFVEIVSQGNSLESARMLSIANLKTNESLQEGIRVQRKTQETITRNKVFHNNGLKIQKHDHIVEDIVIDGEPFHLQALRVDEYYTYNKGVYTLHTLFEAATCDNPVFDHADKTEYYGIAPAFMSIVPGLGQLYKGQTLKGVSLFAGTVACAVGAVFCEDQRKDNVSKMKGSMQPQQYKTRATNWKTGRNVCIGAAAAVWLYNVIDAAAAKGTRRVIVRRAGTASTAFVPVILPDGAALSLTYNF